MNADDLSAIPGLALLLEGANRIERGDDFGHGHGHRGGKEGGNAVLCNAVRHIFDALGLRVGGILAKVAVDMYVDESGCNVIARGVDGARALGGAVNDCGDLARLGIEREGLALEDGVGGNDLTVYDVG